MIIYVALPYSHPDPAIREMRKQIADRYAAKLISQGHIVFSPISHSHHIADHLDNCNDSDFWVRQCEPFLRVCQEMHILALPGWKESTGIGRELKMFQGQYQIVDVECVLDGTDMENLVPPLNHVRCQNA